MLPPIPRLEERVDEHTVIVERLFAVPVADRIGGFPVRFVKSGRRFARAKVGG